MAATGTLVALGLAVAGSGLIASAFLGEPPATVRLVAGIAIVLIAILTAGARLLSRHGAPIRPGEES